MYKYNRASPGNNEYNIADACEGLVPCAHGDHQFCAVIVFSTRYLIFIYPPTPCGSGRVEAPFKKLIYLKYKDDRS